METAPDITGVAVLRYLAGLAGMEVPQPRSAEEIEADEIVLALSASPDEMLGDHGRGSRGPVAVPGHHSPAFTAKRWPAAIARSRALALPYRPSCLVVVRPPRCIRLCSWMPASSE
jgi:hypothetical protein